MAKRTLALSPIEKEKRRKKAVSLKSKGWTQKQIAEELQVSEAAVSQWLNRFDREGKNGLYARKHTGRPPKITYEELDECIWEAGTSDGVLSFLSKKSIHIRSSSQVIAYLEEEFGVTYHEAHISRLLRRLGWRYKSVEFQSERDKRDYIIKLNVGDASDVRINKMKCWELSHQKFRSTFLRET